MKKAILCAVLAMAMSLLPAVSEEEKSIQVSVNLFGIEPDVISMGFTTDDDISWDTQSDISLINLVPGTDGRGRLAEPFNIFAVVVSDAQGVIRVESGPLAAYDSSALTRAVPEADLTWDMTVDGLPAPYIFDGNGEEEEYILFRHDCNDSVANIYVAKVEDILTDDFIKKLEETDARSWKQTFTLVWETDN